MIQLQSWHGQLDRDCYAALLPKLSVRQRAYEIILILARLMYGTHADP